MGYNKEISALCKSLTEQGFEVEVARNGHYRVLAPDGQKCQIPRTPSRNTSVLNAITRLKRIGYLPVR